MSSSLFSLGKLHGSRWCTPSQRARPRQKVSREKTHAHRSQPCVIPLRSSCSHLTVYATLRYLKRLLSAAALRKDTGSSVAKGRCYSNRGARARFVTSANATWLTAMKHPWCVSASVTLAVSSMMLMSKVQALTQKLATMLVEAAAARQRKHPLRRPLAATNVVLSVCH